MTSDKELSQLQVQYLMKRMPNFELSYETIAHKKVFQSYNLGLAVPVGKKFFAWFSFQKSNDVCYLLELNREKKVSKISVTNAEFNSCLSLGTLVYGTVISSDIENKNTEKPLDDGNKKENEGNRFFIIEDMFQYKGIPIKNLSFGEKLGYIEEFMSKHVKAIFNTKNNIVFSLPVIWGIEINSEDEILSDYETRKSNIPYPVHHIQIRKLNEISPYINIPFNNALTRISKPSVIKEKSESIEINVPKFTIDFYKPQYKYPTVFQVSASIQFDIYYLFACGKNKKMVYYNVAYIPNIKSSFFMNSLFRNIRENKNIDYIEESDDESDFQNINEDKYVSLDKMLNMECVFNTKFKRWVPLRVVDNSVKIVHISKLVNDY